MKGIGNIAAHAQVTAALKGHKHTITCLAFAPDGKTLASSNKGDAVILWDVTMRKARSTPAGHKDMVTAVAFTADGKILASAGHDDVIRLWDTTKGKRVIRFLFLVFFRDQFDRKVCRHQTVAEILG